MAVTVDYNQIWEWIAIDWVTKQTFYGADFNPSPFVFPTWWSSVTATNPTALFDLNWFQPWHEVWCWVIVLWSDTAYSTTLYGDFQRYDWSWNTTWDYSRPDFYINAGEQWAWYIYFGVDSDEIWEWYSNYRVHYYTLDNQINFYSPTFDESWLSFDDTRHRSGFIRVEWSRLCYTDWVDGNRWYKHKIAYDSSYSTSVWVDKAWAIRLDSGDNLCIYYVDEYGIRRRTYGSDSWYWWNVNVWSSKSWFMWVADWDMEDWYWHLCFIAPNGSKRRVLNWPVSWST